MPSGNPQVIVAFDYGLRRIGVACGDTLTRHAAPVRTLELDSAGMPPWPQIDALLRALAPSMLVIGLPYNVDGTEGAMTGAARKFATQLAQRYRIETALIDERYSSLEAAQRLRSARASGAKRRRVAKADIDAAAAGVILDRWFSGEN